MRCFETKSVISRIVRILLSISKRFTPAMGNILRALSSLSDAADSDWCWPADGPADDLFVDFEGAQPEREEDAAVYEAAEEVLNKADDVLRDMAHYKGRHTCGFYLSAYLTCLGAKREIREAIGRASPETEARAAAALAPLAAKLHAFYALARSVVDGVLPELIAAICVQDGKLTSYALA